MRNIQLEFICPGCGREGLTPEVRSDEAIGLVSGKLQLRCPLCQAILSMQATEATVKRELFQQTIGTVTFYGIILKQILEKGKEPLTSQVSEAIEMKGGGHLSKTKKSKLARQLMKTIEHVIRDDFSKVEEADLTVGLSQTLETIERRQWMNIEKMRFTRRLSDTIDNVVQKKLPDEKKVELIHTLCETVKIWYKDTVNTILTEWRKTSEIKVK